jgi:hypothetical protein
MRDFMKFLTTVQGLKIRLEKPRPVLRQIISHGVYFAGIKKGRPVGLPLRISSVLDAYDVGSPHAVFWTVCSSGACQYRWVLRPQPA